MLDKDDVLRMARESGFGLISAFGNVCMLQRFAELVAAKEREACAQQVIETREWKGGSWTSTICPATAKAIATAIRARGATDGQPT